MIFLTLCDTIWIWFLSQFHENVFLAHVLGRSVVSPVYINRNTQNTVVTIKNVNGTTWRFWLTVASAFTNCVSRVAIYVDRVLFRRKARGSSSERLNRLFTYLYFCLHYAHRRRNYETINFFNYRSVSSSDAFELKINVGSAPEM